MTHVLVGSAAGLAFLVIAGAILAAALHTRVKAAKSGHRMQATTSHKAPRTQRLGGGIAAVLSRAPAPVAASGPAPAPFADINYPPLGSPATAYAPALRVIGQATGTTSRYEDTSAWSAIAVRRAAEVHHEAEAASEPAPVLAAPVTLDLSPDQEAAMTRFLDAFPEEARNGDAEMDQAAFEEGPDL